MWFWCGGHRGPARSSGVEVVAQAGDVDELLRAVRRHRPDVAVVDIKMPPTLTDEGLVAAQRIRSEHPTVGVLVLSQYLESSYALLLLADHPEQVGYLLKERLFSGESTSTRSGGCTTARPSSTRPSCPSSSAAAAGTIRWPP